MLDQKTKDQFQSKFASVKTRIRESYPDVDDATLNQARTNPDQLVSAIAQSSGRPEDEIANELRQMVSNS